MEEMRFPAEDLYVSARHWHECGSFVIHSLFQDKGNLNKLHIGKLTYLLIGVKQLPCFVKPAKGYLLLDGVQKVEFNHAYFISAHIIRMKAAVLNLRRMPPMTMENFPFLCNE